MAAGVSAAIAGVLLLGIMVYRGTDAVEAISLVWIPVVFGSCIGPIPAMWIAGKYGSLRRWPVGAIAGVAASLVATWAFLTYLAI